MYILCFKQLLLLYVLKINVDVIMHIVARKEFGYFLSGNFSNDQKRLCCGLPLNIAGMNSSHVEDVK